MTEIRDLPNLSLAQIVAMFENEPEDKHVFEISLADLRRWHADSVHGHAPDGTNPQTQKCPIDTQG